MIDSEELFLSILSMDAYNRGYNEGISTLGGEGSLLGGVEVIQQSDVDEGTVGFQAGFYAIAYEVTDASAIEGFSIGDVIIAYRGTDNADVSGLADCHEALPACALTKSLQTVRPCPTTQ